MELHSEEHGRRERILNLPAPLTYLILAFVAVHVLVVYGPDWLSQALFDRFAFVPARFAFQFDPNAVLERIAALDGRSGLSPDDESRLARALNSGPAVYLSPVTYAFLHGDWTHLTVNALSLTAFGSPVARSLGSFLFLLFMGVCAVAGAMTHFALHTYDLSPVVGASAAISGTMAAIARFAFTPGSRLSGERVAGSPYFDSEPRVIPLTKLASNRQSVLFLALWLGFNFFLGAFPQAVGVAGVIAWEAHVGGFLCGLLLFGIFDRAARRAH